MDLGSEQSVLFSEQSTGLGIWQTVDFLQSEAFRVEQMENEHLKIIVKTLEKDSLGVKEFY